MLFIWNYIQIQKNTIWLHFIHTVETFWMLEVSGGEGECVGDGDVERMFWDTFPFMIQMDLYGHVHARMSELVISCASRIGSMSCSLVLIHVPGLTITLIPNWKKWAFGYNTYNFSNISTAVPFTGSFLQQSNCFHLFLHPHRHIRSHFCSLSLSCVPASYSHIRFQSPPTAQFTIAIVKNAQFRCMSNSSSSIWLINYWPHVNSRIANQQSVQLNKHTQRDIEIKMKRKENTPHICYESPIEINTIFIAHMPSVSIFIRCPLSFNASAFWLNRYFNRPPFHSGSWIVCLPSKRLRSGFIVCALPIPCACKCP